MRDVFRHLAYLAMPVATVAAVWVAAMHPSHSDIFYITSDGRLCDGPPPGAPWSRDEVYLSHDDEFAAEGAVATARR